MKRSLILLVIFVFSKASLFSQDCPLISITEQNSIPSTCNEPTLTSLPDALDRPYLYVASKEGGLKIYEISSVPDAVLTIPISQFENLHVNSISQQGNFLFLAVGNSFSDGQSAGLVVIDATAPESAFVVDYLLVPDSNDGSGMVCVSGNRAYLAAMSRGIVIIDISDVSDLQLISQFIPDVNFPELNPDLTKINVRCIAKSGELLYICYDAGGFRVIDVTNEENPAEIGQYSNPELLGLPRAYNNLVVNGNLVFVTVDYCGMEVIDINVPSQPTLYSWWNPWDCTSNPFNWFSSAGHSNEIALNDECDLIFMSTGKSDMYVLDISNPLQPDSCAVFGGTENNMGTWGVSLRGDSVFLTYICSIIPFASNWSGIKTLSYQTNCSNKVEEIFVNDISVYPVPSSNFLTVTIDSSELLQGEFYEVVDLFGRVVDSGLWSSGKTKNIDLTHLANGVFTFRIPQKPMLNVKFVKQ